MKVTANSNSSSTGIHYSSQQEYLGVFSLKLLKSQQPCADRIEPTPTSDQHVHASKLLRINSGRHHSAAYNFFI